MLPIPLAEDDPFDVELAQYALGKVGLSNELIAVRDGQEALDFLMRKGQWSGRASGSPGLVILDLKMPLVTGHEVLRAMRSTAALRGIPVVVLTASRLESDLIGAYEAGANAYVVKDLGLSDFVATVDDIARMYGLLSPPRAAL